eukprot:GHVP01021811.1.p1 GENE.GHVP01021811.1~~GHVP01021811.1.p1  ORF type:complete len:493 (-),score=117.06 GHVP01021811.1:211-1689(-)
MQLYQRRARGSMSIIFAAICQENGIPIVSKQYDETSALRVTQLLQRSMGLIKPGKQNSVIYLDSMRAIYTAFDTETFLILVTKEDSNIIEDTKTLSILFEAISELIEQKIAKEKRPKNILLLKEESVYVPTTILEKIEHSSFEILFAMEELIVDGLQYIQTSTHLLEVLEMDSTEEKIQNNILRDKASEAQEEAKRKMKQISKARKEKTAQIKMENRMYENEKKESKAAPKPVKIKGMKLGMKKESQTGEEWGSSLSLDSSIEMEVKQEEKHKIEMDKEGGLNSFGINGTLRVSSKTTRALKTEIHMEHNTGMKIQTHPNIDKEYFDSDSILRQSNKIGFPLKKEVTVLRWSEDLDSEAVQDIPIRAVVWISDEDGEISISIQQGGVSFSLFDIETEIPCNNDNFDIMEKDGNVVYDNENNLLIWSVCKLNKETQSAVLELRMEDKIDSTINIKFKGKGSSSHMSFIRVLDQKGENVETAVEKIFTGQLTVI